MYYQENPWLHPLHFSFWLPQPDPRPYRRRSGRALDAQPIVADNFDQAAVRQLMQRNSEKRAGDALKAIVLAASVLQKLMLVVYRKLARGELTWDIYMPAAVQIIENLRLTLPALDYIYDYLTYWQYDADLHGYGDVVQKAKRMWKPLPRTIGEWMDTVASVTDLAAPINPGFWRELYTRGLNNISGQDELRDSLVIAQYMGAHGRELRNAITELQRRGGGWRALKSYIVLGGDNRPDTLYMIDQLIGATEQTFTFAPMQRLFRQRDDDYRQQQAAAPLNRAVHNVIMAGVRQRAADGNQRMYQELELPMYEEDEDDDETYDEDDE